MRMFVVLSLLGHSLLAAQDPVDMQGWVNRGMEAFRNARYPEAVAAFQKAVDIDPASVVARLYLANACMVQYIPGADSPDNVKMAATASREYEVVLKLDPNNTIALSSLASLDLYQKKYDAAQQRYEKLTAVDPGNATAYYNLGVIAWLSSYPALAKARADAGMRPDAPGPIKDPGIRQELKARYGPAISGGLQALDTALQIDPSYDDAMAYMNLLIRERADLRDTEEECRQDTALADQWVQRTLELKKAKAEQAKPSTESLPPAQPGPNGPRIRVGGQIQERKLIRRVQPVYPPSALRARIEGTVQLTVTIATDGKVADVSVIDGNPVLTPPAVDAVKQWVYQPTLLNGDPVEVVTDVNVVFSLK